MENKYYLVALTVLIIVLIGAGWLFRKNSLDVSESLTATSTILNQNNNKMTNLITLNTSLGEIQIETYNQDAPNTVANFIKLAQAGYYNNLIFHRVIKGFMIQGGDPNCQPVTSQDKGACGTGGPGYQFADELNPETPSYKQGYKKGVVAMANAGPNTNGSQFFIMHEDYPLDHNYTIFGQVIKGQEVVDKIANTKTGAGDRPVEVVIIKTVTIN